MQKSLLEVLADPVSGGPLTLEASETKNDQIWSGKLKTQDGRSYLIKNGIPRFVPESEHTQSQTQESFNFKWSHRPGYEDPKVTEHNIRDEVERYDLKNIEEFRDIFRNKGWVLEGGCASGHHSSIYVTPEMKSNWVGTDLSHIIEIAQERLGSIPGTHFVQGDLHNLPYKKEAFDVVISRGVMHHTPSTEKAFKSLVDRLKPGGEFVFLIYKKNGPVREFTDNYIRSCVSKLPSPEGWEALKPLATFAESLSKVQEKVVIKEDVPLLEIPKGTYSVQQLVYDYFVKAFYKQGWTMDENNLITFDWYHPQFAFRHTEEEIQKWCDESGLKLNFLKGQWTSWAGRATKKK